MVQFPALFFPGSSEPKVNTHFLPATQITLDPTNYLPAGTTRPRLPEQYETREAVLPGVLVDCPARTPFFALLHEHNATLAYVRIRMKSGKDLAGTIA